MQAIQSTVIRIAEVVDNNRDEIVIAQLNHGMWSNISCASCNQYFLHERKIKRRV